MGSQRVFTVLPGTRRNLAAIRAVGWGLGGCTSADGSSLSRYAKNTRRLDSARRHLALPMDFGPVVRP